MIRTSVAQMYTPASRSPAALTTRPNCMSPMSAVACERPRRLAAAFLTLSLAACT